MEGKKMKIASSNIDRYNDPFPTRLRQLIRENNMTQTALAKVLGLQRQTISQYMDGTTNPPIDKLCKIADHFKVSTDFLLGRTKLQSQNDDNKIIYDKTGLSDKAIQTLIELHNKTAHNILIYGGKPGILSLGSEAEIEDQATIDFLLSNKLGRALLSFLSGYLFSDYVKSEEDNNTSIMLHNKKLGYNRPFDTALIKAGMLVNIQKILLECDKEINTRKEGESDGNHNTKKK